MRDISHAQRLLVGHGALVLLAAFVIGFGFLFYLIGEIRLWPFPGSIQYQMPGTYDAWRMAHMEGIITGFVLWITASIIPILRLTEKTARRVALAMITTAWTFTVASTMDPLFENSRGIVIKEDMPLTNFIAFNLFVVGILAVTWVMILTIKRCLFDKDEQTSTATEPQRASAQTTAY
ncbi:MAG: hypothetical protein AAGB03_02885 [Pseudomonadota bacterium]